MPVSDIGNLTPIAQQIAAIRPKKMLDLGIGMGKYGAIAREILDFTYGRFWRSQWDHEIFGYEGFNKYRNPMWDVYDNVVVRDFTQLTHVGYDLVLVVDSLEHLEQDAGAELLGSLIEHNRKVIVSCPDGDYPQDAVYGNEFERHRSVWDAKTLLRAGGTIIHRGVCAVASFQGCLK